MSIADKLERLQTAKDNIAEAITAKGGTVNQGDGFEEFSSDIGTISSGITVDESYDISEGTLNGATITLDGDVTVHIPDGVTQIAAMTFYNNQIITKVIMPDTVETMGNGYDYPPFGVFFDCSNLLEIELSNNLTTIPSYAFFRCRSLTSITIPDSVTSIGEGAFRFCTALMSVSVLGNITLIGEYAFEGCNNLVSITIPDSVTSIGNDAFSNCTGLTSITIPDSVTSIESNTFNGCSSLTSITIPDSVTSIGVGAFNGCTSLTDIYYTGTQAEWESISGISYARIPEGATIHYEYTPE